MSAIEILSWPFQKSSIDNINNKNDYINYPVIYILIGNKEAYIGETVQFKNLMKDHLKNREKVNKINLIKHDEFNRSATFKNDCLCTTPLRNSVRVVRYTRSALIKFERVNINGD